MSEHHHHPSSYRDPSGFVFTIDGIFYRQVQQSYAEHYEWLIRSKLYDKLVKGQWLLSHIEIEDNLTGAPGRYKTLKPLQLEQISYPYEWSFDQLRDAALHTLDMLTISLEHGMVLKDASPFNIQFREGKPVFIDTLSFEKYEETAPWIAYRQFCECFLFPLYLGHYRGIEVSRLLMAYPDGIPVPVTARMLSPKGRLNMGVWMHVYLQNILQKSGKNGKSEESGKNQKGSQAGSSGLPGENQQTNPGRPGEKKDTGFSKRIDTPFSKRKLERVVQNLRDSIRSLKPANIHDSVWSNYYGETIISRRYLEEKESIFRQFIGSIIFKSALDLGANDGHFSEILAGNKQVAVLAIDADTTCMNRLYRIVREKGIRNIQPLCVDLAAPSPAIGFRNAERSSFKDRARAELVVALAFLHHLVFGRNLPLADITEGLADLTTRWLIVEFVPLEDEKVQELIRNRASFHVPYDETTFEDSMSRHFLVEKKQTVPGTGRVLYLMSKKS